MRVFAAAALLVFAAGCGVLGYTRPQKIPRSSFSGHVGKIPVTVLARMIARTDFGTPGSSGHPGIQRKPPFLIAITPLYVFPQEGPWPHVTCEWDERGTYPVAPPGSTDRFVFTSGDDRRIQELWRFDAELRPALTRLEDHVVDLPGGAWIDAFYVAPLCEQGDRVALMLHYGNPRHLWGQGFIIVLRRSRESWTVEWLHELWIS